MDPNKIVKLLASTLDHFPDCEKLSMMVAQLARHLEDFSLEREAAADLIMKAAGLNVAVRVDADTLDVDKQHVMRYMCVFRALLDDCVRPEDEEEEEGEDADVKNDTTQPTTLSDEAAKPTTTANDVESEGAAQKATSNGSPSKAPQSP